MSPTATYPDYWRPRSRLESGALFQSDKTISGDRDTRADELPRHAVYHYCHEWVRGRVSVGGGGDVECRRNVKRPGSCSYRHELSEIEYIKRELSELLGSIPLYSCRPETEQACSRNDNSARVHETSKSATERRDLEYPAAQRFRDNHPRLDATPVIADGSSVASSGDVCIETADHTQKSDYHSTSTTTTTSDDGSEGPEAQEPGDDDYSPPSRYANSSGTSGTEEALTQDMTVDPFEHKLDKAMPWYRYFALRPCTQSKRDGFIKAIETAWPFVQHAMYLPRGIRPEELMVGSKLKNIKDWDTRLLRMRGELSALTRNDMPSAHASIAAAGGLRNEGDDTSMKTVLGILPIAKFSISEGPKMPVSGSSRPGVAGQQSPSSPLDRESREAGYKNERRGLPLVPESVAGSSRQLNTSAENTRLRCKSRDDYDNDQTMVARNGRMGMRENARIDNNGGHHKGRVEAISPNNFIQQHIDRIIADHSTSKELPQNAGISTAQRHVENIDVVLPARLSAASNARPLPPVGPSVWVWHNQKQFCTHWAMTRHCIYEVTSQGCRHPHVWPDEVTYRKQLPGIEFPPRWMRRSPELHRLCVEGTLVGWPTGDIDALTRAMDAQLPVQSRSALSNFHSAERASEPRQTPVTAPQPSQIGSKGPS